MVGVTCDIGFPGEAICTLFLWFGYIFGAYIGMFFLLWAINIDQRPIFRRYYRRLCEKRCEKDPNALPYLQFDHNIDNGCQNDLERTTTEDFFIGSTEELVTRAVLRT